MKDEKCVEMTGASDAQKEGCKDGTGREGHAVGAPGMKGGNPYREECPQEYNVRAVRPEGGRKRHARPEQLNMIYGSDIKGQLPRTAGKAAQYGRERHGNRGGGTELKEWDGITNIGRPAAGSRRGGDRPAGRAMPERRGRSQVTAECRGRSQVTAECRGRSRVTAECRGRGRVTAERRTRGRSRAAELQAYPYAPDRQRGAHASKKRRRREEEKRRVRERRRKARRRKLIIVAVECAAVICLGILLVVQMQKSRTAGASPAMTRGEVRDRQEKGFGRKVQGISAQDYAEHPPWTEDFLTISEYSRPGEPLGRVKNIFVHYTANSGTSAAQNRSYFEQLKDTHERGASAHFIIGYDGEIIQCVPLDEVAYAVRTRNQDSISIECCYKSADASFTQETYHSLIQLLSWLTKAYGLTEQDILRHYDCGGKKCPLYYTENEDAWEKLRRDVKGYGM